MKLQNKKGFSIVETTIAALIFAMAAAGILSMISIMRQPGVESEKRIAAAYYGQQILTDLRGNIDQRNWNSASGPLAPGSHTGLSSGIYTGNYTVTQVNAADPMSARKVTVTITWPD